MIRPVFLDLEVGSPRWSALLAEVGQQHGHALTDLASRASRLFGIASPFAPGLYFVGGEALGGGDYPVDEQAQSNAIGFGGAGLTRADALASCLGEMAERLSLFEHQGDVAVRAPLDQVRERLLGSVGALAERTSAAGGHASCSADWMDAADLSGGPDTLVPADWVLHRSAAGPLTLPGTAVSTGTAAAGSVAGAAVSALLELVERDAVALWWVGGRYGRPVPLDGAAGLLATRLLDAARGASSQRQTWLLDITSDVGIPTIAAISVDRAGGGFACGTATRLELAAAARAAILELCQMELALLIVDLKREQSGEQALNAADLRQIERSRAINAHSCDLLHPRGAPIEQEFMPGPVPDPTAAYPLLRRRFNKRGIEAVLVELTRPTISIPVVSAFSAILERYPSTCFGTRVASIQDVTGGGEKQTGGVRLM